MSVFHHYVSPLEYDALLNACPSQEWRLFIALMRIGGLRVGEALALEWSDIDWEKGLMKVRSGVKFRLVPLFQDIQSEMKEPFDETNYILEKFRGKYPWVRKAFIEIIRKAGLEPWDYPFQTLRESRSVELFNEFPPYLAGNWMGQKDKADKVILFKTSEEEE